MFNNLFNYTLFIQGMESNFGSSRSKHHSQSLLQSEPLPFQLPPIRANRHEKSLSAYRLVDYSMDRVSYKGEKLKYISSKVDFFNPNNQHKLDVSKNNILKYSGAKPMPPKSKPEPVRRKHSLPPALHLLVQQYLKKREEREDEEEAMVPLSDRKKYLYFQ